ncbi:hypothetical protein [Kitasatospora purpeofusca]|uniref:hypothetical protein n=1 Tax=Kitasatospora purpeofusca TaxID=67352 RepID=UPI0038227C0F
MAVHAIAYVESSTRDKRPAVDHLVVTSGRGIWTYLDAFGDGVADIDLTCDDVASTRPAAVAR